MPEQDGALSNENGLESSKKGKGKNLMEKVLELLQDEAFVEELDKLEDEKDVIALFESRGATVTMDQLRELFSQLPEQGEIKEDDLDKVAGGTILLTPTITVTIGKSISRMLSRGILCRITRR